MYKDKYSRYYSKRCVHIKIGVKYKVAYYLRRNNGNLECFNFYIIYLYL